MQPFTKHTGIVAVLNRPNVDTDQIISAQYMKRIERTGYGEFLFQAWRHLPDGSLNPEFELNRPAYQGASILVAGRNFGSGSSREHAVWAILQAGYRAVVVPSLADIFHKNCFENGLVPVFLPENVLGEVMDRAEASPGYRMTVDLEQSEIFDDQGFRAPFVVHPEPQTHKFRRHCLLNGLDEIGLTLHHEDKINAYERRRWPTRFDS